MSACGGVQTLSSRAAWNSRLRFFYEKLHTSSEQDHSQSEARERQSRVISRTLIKSY